MFLSLFRKAGVPSNAPLLAAKISKADAASGGRAQM
jgi:hypothetical protein